MYGTGSNASKKEKLPLSYLTRYIGYGLFPSGYEPVGQRYVVVLVVGKRVVLDVELLVLLLVLLDVELLVLLDVELLVLLDVELLVLVVDDEVELDVELEVELVDEDVLGLRVPVMCVKNVKRFGTQK